jgi:ketose-bisphosphate aldolase
MRSIAEILQRALETGQVVPAFNIPYLPMMEAVVKAVIDSEAFALIEVARLEWLKFESVSLAAVAGEFANWRRPDAVRLHLDHVPVIDEDDQRVDYLPIFREAVALGFESVMIDGSRLPLDENITATRQVVELGHAAGVAVEAELGAVLGHEDGPLPPYDELFTSGRGFTAPEDARRFVQESGCDWLSVAIGNFHGAISASYKDQKKAEARLNLEQLEQLAHVTQIPLVLHGGSGIQQEYIRAAIQRGIAKINVGTEIRQPYETALQETGSVSQAQQAVYERTCWVITEYLGIAGNRKILAG